tara:strand:+ start:6411 stop:8114 length:1704 start_codon:yes stop_codon:yes gene_type:complete
MTDIVINSEFISEFNEIKTNEEYEKFIHKIQRKNKISLSKRYLINIYNQLELNNPVLHNIITKKNVRSHSGVIVITVFTSPYPEYIENGKKIIQQFSCQWNCHYCPNEPPNIRNGFTQQPRSYLFTEPGVLRANDCNFNCEEQMNSRMTTLMLNGHFIDKLEILVLGGTWCSYPKQYQEEFIRDIYYSANSFVNLEKRDKLSLDEEISLNENAKVHIIGLTLETRPDTINMNELKQFRRFGCTRVQIGLQHTDNDVLKYINRGHSIETTLKAIKLLKENAFKVDIHIMPNLPGSSLSKDYKMFCSLLYDSKYQADQWKIYPCAVTPYTKIEEWYNEGKFKPYEEDKLFNLIKGVKKGVPKYIRLNRIIRDITKEDVLGGYENTHMRQLLQMDMKKNNWKCNCIRCREIKNERINHYELNVQKYEASDGIEYFISLDTLISDKLIGFLRLRINNSNDNVLNVLKNSSLVRELHIYGNVSPVGNRNYVNPQHNGYGKMLLNKAEEISKSHGIYSIVVISGVGVRNYYMKQGYKLEDTYMKKVIKNNKIYLYGIIVITLYVLFKKKIITN